MPVPDSKLGKALNALRDFVHLIESRAMACDGPVTPFVDELSACSAVEKDRFTEILRQLYAVSDASTDFPEQPAPAAKMAFAAELAKHDIKLPLRLSATDAGVIVDSDQRPIMTIDVSNERDDLQVLVICAWMAEAVNAYGGFMGEAGQ